MDEEEKEKEEEGLGFLVPCPMKKIRYLCSHARLVPMVACQTKEKWLRSERELLSQSKEQEDDEGEGVKKAAE